MTSDGDIHLAVLRAQEKAGRRLRVHLCLAYGLLAVALAVIGLVAG